MECCQANSQRTAFVRANPLSKMALAFILMCGVLFSIDIVSASVMLALQVLLLPLTGLRIGVMLKRLWFLPGAALIALFPHRNVPGERHRAIVRGSSTPASLSGLRIA